jgi:glutamate synthase domain-containing protein 2/rubredoxin
MAKYQCALCSEIYDEELSGMAWADLPPDWVCPVCGSPKSSFAPMIVPATSAPKAVMGAPATERGVYECSLCSEVYDERKERVRFADLPDDWRCPVCGSPKSAFFLRAAPPASTKPPSPLTSGNVDDDYLSEWRRPVDEIENHMTDIHNMSVSGKVTIEPMRTRMPTFSWDEILIKGAQLATLPLNKSQPVSTITTIGPAAAVPLVLSTPVFVSHMSFGALSMEAKLSLAKGSAAAGTAMCSGEGGIIPESLAAAHRYIFEYVPNKYSVTDDYLQRVDAVEIKIGQSAKPGMGGHLPGHKVTKEIAAIRGFREGKDITSPSRFPDIRTRDDLKSTVACLRRRSGGKPIGIKLAAGQIEADIDIALYAGADFITIDGRAGGTAAALKVVKNAASVPTIFALAKARRVLDERGATDVSLIVTGGLRVASDFAKALAMGADAIAVATAAMMAVGCQQYRICDTDRCPMGITTQDPALRARLDVERSAVRVANYFSVATEELGEFARLTGNANVHDLTIADLCTTNSEISTHTNIEHV